MTGSGPIPEEPRARPRGSGRLLLAMLIGVAGCLAAGFFELHRALTGHEIAWVYTVEWPIFAVFGVYMWWRLAHEPMPHPTRRAAPTGGAVTGAPRADDPQLAAWQRYLAELQAADPPGQPPDRGG